MIRVRAGCLVIALLCAGIRPASAADPGVLVQSGTVASDGLALDAIARPAAASASDVAFVGSTSALLLRQGGTTTVIAKTGDALPGGLSGTFDAVFEPALAGTGTRVAFAATLNASAPAGVFRYEGGALVPVVTGSQVPSGVAVNTHGDVVFRLGSVLSLVPQGSSNPVRVAGLDDPVLGAARRARFFGRSVLSDAGAVAFVVDNRRGPGGGVFGWSATSGVVAVGRAGDASPVAGQAFAYTRRQTAAINVAGQIAFTAALDPAADTAVFVYDPAGAVTRTVATVGAAVGGAALTGIDPEYVGIDAAGRVVFEGRFGGARRLVLADGGTLTPLGGIESGATDFAPALGAGTRVGWIRAGNVEAYDGGSRVVLTPGDVPLGPGFALSHPAIDDAGAAVCAASRSALYRLAGGVLSPVVRDGDAIGAIGPIAGIADGSVRYAYRGDTLVVLATDGQGRSVLGLDGPGGLAKLVASGDPMPGGGTFAPASERSVDIRGRAVVFSSPVSLPDGSQRGGLFGLRSGRPVRVLLRPGAPAPGGGTFGDLTLLEGTKKPLFRASLADGRTGLFVLRRRRAAKIVRSGDAAPGAGVFGDLRTVASAGAKLSFTAFLGTGDGAPQGLFRWRRGRLQKVAASGDPSPAGGVFASFAALDLDVRSTVFGATIDDAGQTKIGVFRGRPGRLEAITVAGDPLGGGATLSLDGLGSVAVDGQLIGFVGARSETTSDLQSALFEVRGGVLGVLAVAGQPTPLGGTYGAFTDDNVARLPDAVVVATTIDGPAPARAALFTLPR